MTMNYVLAFCCSALLWFGTQAQDDAPLMDLSKERIVLLSSLSQMSGSADQNFDIHRIEIDLVKKRIKIINQENGAVVYDIGYISAYSGQGKSVSLKEGETMFMARDDKVNIVTFEEKTTTMSMMHHDKTIQLYGRMAVEITEDAPE